MIKNLQRSKMKIDILISIGGACRTRYQIDSFCKKNINDYVSESYYFDWLMMGGIQGVNNVISRGFEISPPNIVLFEAGGKFIPQDKISGHTFLHDFGGGWWEGDYKKALSRLNENMEQTIHKYEYLGRKTDAILKSDCEVGLIYHGQCLDSSLNDLLKIIFHRYGRYIPVINIKESNQEASSVDGIHTAFVDDNNSPKLGHTNEWEGWDESWYAALTSLVTLTQKNNRPI